MKTVFCDESGFDGNNLWHPDQPYFSYAAVCMSPEEADKIVAEAMAKFKPPGDEIKTAKLLRSNPGRKTVKWILEKIHGSYQVVCCHKRYCLAAKFYEYMLEPILSDASSYFYDNGLHKLVANVIYLSAFTENQFATKTLVDFQQLMRNRDAEELATVLDSLAKRAVGAHDFLNAIATIIVCNQTEIETELETLAGESEAAGIEKWILELTATALRSLLIGLSGNDMLPLLVTCDDSKPLRAGQHLFDTMIGRTDCREVTFDGRTSQLTFNLAEKIRFSESTKCSGIQLADVAASSATYALKNEDSRFGRYWRETHANSVHEESIFPDLSVLDLSQFQTSKNMMILIELASRSTAGESLTANLRQLDSLSDLSARHFHLDSKSTSLPSLPK